MNQYTPGSSKIVHPVKVDFGIRGTISVIHITQYDDQIPVVEVSLYHMGLPFTYDTATANFRIRFRKHDATFVYLEALGYNATTKTVYFPITRQMTVRYGRYMPVVEMIVNGEVAHTGPFSISIDRNPIQDGDIESNIEAPILKGAPGKDGITPHIGANNNWYFGDEDSGIRASGTPVKGMDYWTDSDKSDIVQEVLDAVPESEAVAAGLSTLSIDTVKEDDGNTYLVMYGSDGEEICRTQISDITSSGGGVSTGYSISLKNLLESRTLTCVYGMPLKVRFQYTSVDADGNDDGPGVGTLTVGGLKVATLTIEQGVNELDIASYIAPGSNSVKLRVENSEGSSRTLGYSATVVSLSLTTTFSDMGIYRGEQSLNYTVTGTGTKTVHFKIDGVEFGSEEVSSSGRSKTYPIPAQANGSHVLEVYAEVITDGVIVISNTLTLGMIWVSDDMSAPAIVSTFSQSEAVQGEILTIPWMAYDPQDETASVTLSIIQSNGTVYWSKPLSVDRTRQEWTVNDYPEGAVVFQISCGSAVWSTTVSVSASELDIEPITDALTLLFDPVGRSNLEETPDSWSQGDVVATFNGVGFSAADGWMNDDTGAALLRLLPGGQMTIPFKPFETDARSSGTTIEVEMATHNVRDYDTIVMSCLSGGRGFKIASQYAEIQSEQSSLSMQFREDEKVRVSFVVEPRNLHRLIYVYVDGIMCGAIQYPENDNFAQSPAVGLTIGAESSGIDIYKIRMYSKGLTRYEVLDNYIADRPLLSERIDAVKRNDIFDQSDNIVISKLPATLPYMVIKCAELPQTKPDPQTCSIDYVDPADTARSFSAEGVAIDVQGTSSAGYKKKNFTLKLENGVTYTATGQFSDTYLLRADSIPASVFCMKADVASSEGANNVELVRLYNDTVPYQTAPQQVNPNVRVGIDGRPCVVFWQNTKTNVTQFWGKYNFNFDKSAVDVFGFTSGCESWEIRNNTSNRALFKTSDFTGTDWQNDFEGRYPNKNTDSTKLKVMCDWVASTNRDAATNVSLGTSVVYDGVTYTQDTAAYRLAKFKAEFEDHFIKTPMLFYYIFTEVFLMVDNRAKNFFPTTYDGVHWQPLPYDFDTAIGINNEGLLVFDYDLEDTDQVDGNNVFNGQTSVLWCNVRDAFSSELKKMYQDLRGGTTFNYAETDRRFTEHQSVWPEAVWNEDSWEKYLEPLETDKDGSYLAMLQGDKSSQRKWWLFNGFRYRDSKYQCGDASENYITLRCYAIGDITVTPYSHIWPRIKYGSYVVTKRGKRNVPCTLENPVDTMDDTEVYIYSADRLASIGDLSPIQVGYANFSMAKKLQSLKLGDGSTTYTNTHLNELYLGNNELLTELDIQNCSALAMTVDLSGCVSIETVKANGSAITGLTLPVGGKVKTLELPGTVTNFTIRDQAQLEDLTMAGYSALTTLRVENTPNIPYETIINNAENLNRVRLINVSWTATSESTLQTSITKLKSCMGMDAAGDNTAVAVVTGRVYVPSVSAALLTEINEAFPQLVVVANGEPQYIVRYLDWDNTVLYRAVVAEGGNAVNAVTAGYIAAPTREGTDDTGYAFKDFGTLPTNIHGNMTVIAQYSVTYRVRFMNGDAVFNTQWVTSGSSATVPSGTPTKASTAKYSYTFSRWSGNYTNVTAPVDVTAVYTSTVRTYTVKFYNGTTLLQTVTGVAYGGTASYTGATPTKDGVSDPDNYVFSGWSPANSNIQSDTSCYAQYNYIGIEDTITDSWEEILAAVADGTYKTKYQVGDTKLLDMGSAGTVAMQIAAFDADTLADGSGKAPISWISEQVLPTTHRMNPALVTNYGYEETNGWGNYSSAISTSSAFNVPVNGYLKASEEATWKLEFTAASAFKVQVPSCTIYSSGSGFAGDCEYEVTVNGTTIYKNIGDTASVATGTSISIESGEAVTIILRFRQDSKATLTAYRYLTGYLKFTDSADAQTSLATVVYGSNTSSWTSKATITISKNQIRYTESHAEGTGAIGGWGKSEMRTYLTDSIKPQIPAIVQAAIKPVAKKHPIYNTAGSNLTQTTTDEVWLPSYDEIFGSNSLYYPLFQNTNANRIKKKAGATSAYWWWLRSADGTSSFRGVGDYGSSGYISANYADGVVLGFCT